MSFNRDYAAIGGQTNAIDQFDSTVMGDRERIAYFAAPRRHRAGLGVFQIKLE
jgi:hypothetical protein